MGEAHFALPCWTLTPCCTPLHQVMIPYRESPWTLRVQNITQNKNSYTFSPRFMALTTECLLLCLSFTLPHAPVLPCRASARARRSDSSGQSVPDVLSTQKHLGCILLSNGTENVLKPLLQWCIYGCRGGNKTLFIVANRCVLCSPSFKGVLRHHWCLFQSRSPWTHSITYKAIRLSDVSSSTRHTLVGLIHPGLKSLWWKYDAYLSCFPEVESALKGQAASSHDYNGGSHQWSMLMGLQPLWWLLPANRNWQFLETHQRRYALGVMI